MQSGERRRYSGKVKMKDTVCMICVNVSIALEMFINFFYHYL